MEFRKLTNSEIDVLEKQGCRAQDWDSVSVKEGFKPDPVENVHFSGKIRLGTFEHPVQIDEGISVPAGIYRCTIQDCTIGDDVHISDVKHLVRYDIADNVIIENIGSIVAAGESAFGNGTELEIINEGGGRELCMFDRMSAQIAYIIANYRHDETLIARLNEMIQSYVASKKATRGRLDSGVRIENCTQIRNVNIGEGAEIRGALRLSEGTISSTKADPARIGEGVIASDFILLTGSVVDGGAMLSRCFVGQGVQIGKQYSAENSAFFANSEGFHGEACSIFAGPYTVTHHKSTLLIAGQYSFYNAGSGTNESNHMYKLGPVHQGILERGSKTGSFSYLLWPCRIGAFTAVIGKHTSNFDTSNLPFSYITEERGKSILTPAMNLFTVGIRRDSAKWKARDRRKAQEKFDLIHFELFNPYIMEKIVQGIEILKSLYENASREQELVSYKGIFIKRLMLKTCAKYYEMAIAIFIGTEMMKRLGEMKFMPSLEEIRMKLAPRDVAGSGRWVDVAGMLAPSGSLELLFDAVRSGRIESIDEMQEQLKLLHGAYDDAAWNWCLDLIHMHLGIDIEHITLEHLRKIISDWKINSLKLNNMILKDAEKEFDSSSMIGFGIDGDDAIKIKDFTAVRGSFEANKFVAELKKESENIEQRAHRLLTLLEG
ncbi:DUF4954 family protein [candidate division KSB1 bacterium]|nr:DUF4954 family protein [candidate division KSB1 bacterium]